MTLPQFSALALPMPLSVLLIATLVVFVAYVVFGVTGFGSTVVGVPLLAQVLPLQFAVPLMMLLDFSATLLLGSRLKRGARWDELRWLLPLAGIGMLLGLTLLVQVSERYLLCALGLFVLSYASWGLLRRGPATRLGRRWVFPIGLIGGALSALFGTGGVLFAIYTSSRISDKNALRETNATTIMFSASTRLLLFGVVGLLNQPHLWTLTLLLIPAMLLGYVVGHRLHAAIPAAGVLRVVYGVLIVAGVSLLIRSQT